MTISVIELPRITALGEPIASETSSSAPERRVSTKAKHIVIAVALAAIVAPTSNMGQPVTALIGGLTDSSSNGTVSVPQQTEPSIKRPSVALSVRHLYEASGLTWEQLARLFGVSRRAVHNWANGGRMTARHVEISRRRGVFHCEYAPKSVSTCQTRSGLAWMSIWVRSCLVILPLLVWLTLLA